jgi:hypothetical protein
MAYVKTVWQNRQGINLNKFAKSQETAESVVLENTPDSITAHGTPFSVENMNKIEQGVFDAHEGIWTESLERQQTDMFLQAEVNAVQRDVSDVRDMLGTSNGGNANVILPKDGYFGLYINPAGALKSFSLYVKPNNDLIAVVDDDEPNMFRYDPAAGNLYISFY